METTIYIIVGKQIRPAKAKIIGKIARVPTPHGILEFSRWHLTERAAKLAMARKRKLKQERK